MSPKHMNGTQLVTLSLGHEQTAETTGMDLTDNLMDAEPVQTFDGDMDIHYAPHISTRLDLSGASQDITQLHFPHSSFKTTESPSQSRKGLVAKPAG